MKGQTYVILAIIVLIIVSIFAVTNVDSVQVNYLFWSGESPLILIILFSVLMGGLITAGAGSFKIFHLQREKKAMKLEIKQLKDLLNEHNLLVEDDVSTTQKNKAEGIEQQKKH